MRWEKNAVFCRQKKVRLEIRNGNLTVPFLKTHAFRSHLHAELQNCNKIDFQLLLNHSKRGQYQTGNMKPGKAFIGCSIPVIRKLTSNLRIITKGRNFRPVYVLPGVSYKY